jgi:putative peptidoglycan lipid II flippase
VLLNVVLSLLWLPTLGARGLLLANSLSQTLQAVLLLWLVARLVHGINWGALANSIVKIALASLAMLAALQWIAALGVHPEPTLASRAWLLFGEIAIGGAVFIAAARALGIEELDLAWKTIVAKFEKNIIAPSENRDAPIA